MIRAALFGATCALTAIGSTPAHAAFPGKPGPIAYSKVRSDATVQGAGDWSRMARAPNSNRVG